MDEVTSPQQVLADRLATLAQVQADVALALGGAQQDLAAAIVEPYIALTEASVYVDDDA